MRFLTTFQIHDFIDTLVSLTAAFVLGTLIGAERQYRQRNAGLRTNVLVAVGAAAFVDLAMHLTGADGAVGVTFLDNTMVSAGPSTVFSIESYKFNSTTHDGQFDASLKKGSLAVVSGKMVKQTPGSMRVRTPSSVMGVRGTEFLVRVD